MHFARVRGGQLSEVRHGGGIARASEDDGVWLCGEGGDEGEAWGGRSEIGDEDDAYGGMDEEKDSPMPRFAPETR